MAEEYYTTVEDLQEDLNIDAAEEIPYLTSLAKAASRQIDKYCRRQFWYAERTLRFAPGSRLVVPHTPLITIESSVDGETGAALTEDDYTLEDPEAGIIWLDSHQYRYGHQAPGIIPTFFAATKRSHILTYTSGYKTPTQTLAVDVTAEDLPSDIELATRMMVADFYSNRGSNPRVKRRHLLECAVWYDNMFRDQTFAAMLDGHRRLVQS